MTKKLWIDRLDVWTDLMQELAPRGAEDDDSMDRESQIVDWLSEHTIMVGGFDDTLDDFLLGSFEAGWLAAHHGVDHITVCENIGSDYAIIPGSKEKLLRDLCTHLRQVHPVTRLENEDGWDD